MKVGEEMGGKVEQRESERDRAGGDGRIGRMLARYGSKKGLKNEIELAGEKERVSKFIREK